MALHRGVRRPRAVGREHRPDTHGLDRCVRAVSGGGVVRQCEARPWIPARTRSVRLAGRRPQRPARRRRPGISRAMGSAGLRAGVSLHERGVFSWKEWAATLGEEIKKAQAAGDPDTGETYYHHWLAALERLVAAKGLADRRAWRAPATRGSAPASARRTAFRSRCSRKISANRPSRIGPDTFPSQRVRMRAANSDAAAVGRICSRRRSRLAPRSIRYSRSRSLTE